MSKRLVKVAKELNVGTGSIVDFLAKKGFEIDNRPTARVSEEMYNLLVQEFQSSMALKEQADQLVIGTSRQIQEEEKEPEEPRSPFQEPAPAREEKKEPEKKIKEPKKIAEEPRSEEHTSELQSRGHLVCR